eukprot:SAG31_NODE_266_length_18815_cov_17.009243_19_plen_62_part_00
MVEVKAEVRAVEDCVRHIADEILVSDYLGLVGIDWGLLGIAWGLTGFIWGLTGFIWGLIGD